MPLDPLGIAIFAKQLRKTRPGNAQITRGKRLPPRRSGGFSPSALSYPDFYLIIAWFAEHFIAFAFFDVPLPFLVWHAEHFRPKFTALGTHIWIQDEWDT